MANSLSASTSGLQTLDQQRRKKGWSKQNPAPYVTTEHYFTESTLKRFWAGKAVKRETFIQICRALNTDWRTVETHAFG
ncbi:MAG: hypothetical protein HC810_02630 [Acaryochloridaceae cyanobacterium RL_2_7]|nr:hypothetical protein [Acaryochloridaceae cyanobacterium RL_2_7]